MVLVAVTAVGPWRDQPPAVSQSQLPLQAPDFTNTPEGEADRYFDQAMRAHESGDSTRARFSGQMALGAYSGLSALTADQRFHVGLLHQINSDHSAMLAQADSIEITSRDHLFADLLRGRVYLEVNDEDALRAVYADFLSAYEAEIATNRPEYQAHRSLIETFREDAIRSVGR